MAYSTDFCIKLIDTIVNNYITVQERWKILEITITMCLHCHAHCNCNCSSQVIGKTYGSFQSRRRSRNIRDFKQFVTAGANTANESKFYPK